MPSFTYTTEPAVNPLAPLVELASQLTSTMLHVCFGLAAGLIVAHVLRRGHLRWTWVTGALAPLVLDPTMFSGWSAASWPATITGTPRARAAPIMETAASRIRERHIFVNQLNESS